MICLATGTVYMACSFHMERVEGYSHILLFHCSFLVMLSLITHCSSRLCSYVRKDIHSDMPKGDLELH